MRKMRAFAVTLACAAALTACDRHGAPPPPAPEVKPKPKAPAPSAAPVEVASADEAPPPILNPSNPEAMVDATEALDAGSTDSPLLIDKPIEIGFAGPATADARGVVQIDRNNAVHFAKRTSLGVTDRVEYAHFADIEGGPNDFFAVARGPCLLRGKAYWVSDGKLVRRAIDGSGELEVLSKDARNGTRVASSDVPGMPASVVYVTNPLKEDDPPRAKLWVEGAGVTLLSPEGAGASGVAAANAAGDLLTIAIDARSAMTPVHGRRVHFENGKPQLGPDVVMWVGASAQTLSEIFAANTPLGIRAFLPIERDISHFGLVMLELGAEPRMDPKAVWRGYPNGIDVAPVAGGALCGRGYVAYVRPLDAEPGAKQTLEVAEITADGLGTPVAVSSARGFANLSIASSANAAVLAYVADRRTFASTLRCRRRIQ